MGDSMKEAVETLDPVVRRLVTNDIQVGTLVPLKTTLELRDNLSLGEAYVTRAPTKSTNDVVNVVRALAGDDAAKNLPHLRRCSKPSDLPPHLKEQFMNQTPNGRQLHVGKATWLYIMLGPVDSMSYDQLLEGLSAVEGIRDDLFLTTVPVPLLAPTSQVQANMWSQQFWQCVYRKNNPLGPHPSNICRTTTTVDRDASVWMNLAHQVARKSQKAGLGEPIGAVIVKRTIPIKADPGTTAKAAASGNSTIVDKVNEENSSTIGGVTHEKLRAGNSDGSESQANGNKKDHQAATSSPDNDKETVRIVALAADVRWYKQAKTGHTGNPMAHAALRAISMVAQKLVKAENREIKNPPRPILEFETFQDKPLLADEQVVFEADHPSPDGYLCHDLELYMTHEPCTMCSMAILHSRMGRIVFRHRMPLTGGMSSEDRGHDHCRGGDCERGDCGGGQGLGLHWRKELNWSMLGWEWTCDTLDRLDVNPHLHA